MQQASAHESSSPIAALFRPIRQFFQMEAAGGILLMISAAIALIWANSPFAEAYFHLWHAHVAVEIGSLKIDKHLLHWINDGLMAIFFLLVGLEIKREVLTGELASPKKAALPIAAAIGGMLVPALFYVAFNAGSSTISGWGVPMATDIAFALGVIILLGKRVPTTLKIFIVALAIVDDLGAVLVIAFFYTSKVSFTALIYGAVFLVGLIVANRLGVRKSPVYVILGICLWVAFLKSGVHATLAGVLMALTIPSSRKSTPYQFMEANRKAMYDYMGGVTPDQKKLTHKQEHAVHDIEHAARNISSPMERFEHSLHSWVTFLIMPIFAFANAGVSFAGIDIGAAITSPVALGIIVGLFLGKQFGIFGFSWLAIKFGLAEMPAKTNWKQLYGVSMLAGIGFTMSLFIASLAFTEAQMLDIAKIGIITASLLSGIVGWMVLSSSAEEEDTKEHIHTSTSGHQHGASRQDHQTQGATEIVIESDNREFEGA